MTSLAIEKGPSKFDLMLALFDWKPHRRKVEFVANGESYFCVINSVEAEDGSGESWNIKGEGPNHKKFNAWYRTDSRKGIAQAE